MQTQTSPVFGQKADRFQVRSTAAKPVMVRRPTHYIGAEKTTIKRPVANSQIARDTVGHASPQQVARSAVGHASPQVARSAVGQSLAWAGLFASVVLLLWFGIAFR